MALADGGIQEDGQEPVDVQARVSEQVTRKVTGFGLTITILRDDRFDTGNTRHADKTPWRLGANRLYAEPPRSLHRIMGSHEIADALKAILHPNEASIDERHGQIRFQVVIEYVHACLKMQANFQ